MFEFCTCSVLDTDRKEYYRNSNNLQILAPASVLANHALVAKCRSQPRLLLKTIQPLQYYFVLYIVCTRLCYSVASVRLSSVRLSVCDVMYCG